MPGNSLPVFRVPLGDGGAVDVAIAICEDLWQDGGPVAVCRQAGAGLLVVPNASPYERGKDDVRLELVTRRAREAGAVLAYCNLVGGQDELVFDGDSILVTASGEVLARGPQFEEELVVADLELPRPAGRPAGDATGRAAVDAGATGPLITIERRDPAGPAAAREVTAGRGRARAVLAAAGRPGRGVRGAGARDGGLRAEERVPLGASSRCPAGSTRR